MLCGDQKVEALKLFYYVQALTKCQMSTSFFVYLDGCSILKMKHGLALFHEVSRVSGELLAKRKMRFAELYAFLKGQRVEATDPRDKVYSLLGMAIEAEDPSLHVSYTESAYSVYHRFTRRLMELDREHAADLLYLAAGPRDGCASWAIDFDEDPQKREANFAAMTDVWHTMPAAPTGICVAIDEALLLVDASRFDGVIWVSGAVPGSRTSISMGYGKLDDAGFECARY